MKVNNVAMIGMLVLATGTLVFKSRSSAQTQEALPPREINGIRFRIPPGYEESKSRNPYVFILRQSHTYALLKVYFEHRSSDIPGHQFTQQEMDRLGLRKTGEREAIFAGRSGGCVEYSVKAKSGIPLAQAECSFGTELHTSFFGSPQNMVEFYDFMQAAEPARKEQRT